MENAHAITQCDDRRVGGSYAYVRTKKEHSSRVGHDTVHVLDDWNGLKATHVLMPVRALFLAVHSAQLYEMGAYTFIAFDELLFLIPA